MESRAEREPWSMAQTLVVGLVVVVAVACLVCVVGVIMAGNESREVPLDNPSPNTGVSRVPPDRS